MVEVEVGGGQESGGEDLSGKRNKINCLKSRHSQKENWKWERFENKTGQSREKRLTFLSFVCV